MALRCIIVDDNAGFLASASRLLERQGLHVLGTASSWAGARELLARTDPDVVLLDVELGTESGFDVAAQIAATNRRARIVLISTHREDELAELITAAPVVGFLQKSRLSAGAVASLLPGT